MSNVQNRKALLKDPQNIVDLFSAADLPPAITAPDGVSRVPLALNTRYYVHKTFVWPRCLFPVATNPNVTFNSTDIVGPGGAPPEIQIDGDDTPHFWGREMALVQFFNLSIKDVGNAGAGRSSRLFDFVGGSGNAFSFFVLNFVTLRSFKRLGDIVDMGIQISAVFQVDNEGGFVTRINPSVTVPKTYFIGNIYFIQAGNATVKPQIVFQGAPPSATFSNSNLNMVAGDASVMVDEVFSGELDMVGNSYVGVASGDYFRPNVSQALASMANADIPISAFANAGGGETRVSVAPGHGLTAGQTILIGDAGAPYDGTHTILRVAPDEASFDIAVAFTSTTTGNVKLTRVTTTADTSIVNNETISISGTTSYNGTFKTVFALGNNTFDIPVAFVADDATGTVTSVVQTQKTVGVNSLGNGAQANSKAIGSWFIVGNAALTTIVTQNVFVDLNLAAGAISGSNIERWTLTDTTTGELRYDGDRPFSGQLVANVSAKKTGAAIRLYHLRAVKNGVELPDPIRASFEVKETELATGLIVPIEAVNGDTIRLQLANQDATDDVTVINASVVVR